MLSVDQLGFLLARAYPDLTRSKDYWVAHPVDGETLLQSGPAWIVQWNTTAHPVPLSADIEAMWAKYGDECTQALAERDARAKRDGLLRDAHDMVETAIDQQDAAAEQAARAYRQALRDVPAQTGFPMNIDWPAAPTLAI